MLRNKTFVELRGIAQSFGIADIFSMDQNQLIQAIELKQQSMVPEPVISIPKPQYDARLMSKPPSRTSTQTEIVQLLQPYTARGMHLDFPEPEVWSIRHGDKSDTGTIRQPLRVILQCASKLMANGVVRE
jgi:hypothetical protein